MTIEEAQTRAIMSILDVVEEIVDCLAPRAVDPRWAEVVHGSFKEHRAELRDPKGHTLTDLLEAGRKVAGDEVTDSALKLLEGET